jgi:ubiquinone/menaquinone biosynthesis C-methylase UbiE
VKHFRQRFNAWALSHESAAYDALVGPRKERLLTPLRGTVLEIGPGTGPNLRFYHPTVRLLAAEPNAFMHPYLRERAERIRRPLELHRWRAERLEIPDRSVDAVVATLVLCSVISARATLGEVMRVLKPGGVFAFLEHVAAPPERLLHDLQRAVRPLWAFIADGCHPDRETERTIRRAGFYSVEVERFSVPAPLVSPHICGRAVKPL